MRYFLFVLALLAPFTYANSEIIMSSDSGDFIGAGKQYTFLTSDIPFTQISDSRVSISTNIFFFSFSAPNNRTLAPGGFFNAERDPFRGPLNPGIEITGDGRGCNTIAGEFYIYEIDTATSKLALDFVQHCEGGAPALRGSIRINSDIPIPYNGVLAIATSSTLSALEGSTVNISAEKSISFPTAASYKWEQTKGKPINILDTSASKTTITLPSDVDLGGEDLELKLTVTSTANISASTNLIIHAISKSDPQTYLQFSGAAGDFISGGRTYFYDKNNSMIGLRSLGFANAAEINVSSSTFWTIDFSAPNNAPLTIKNYPFAQRFPFQEAAAAGLSIFGDGRGCNESFGSFNIKQISLTEPMRFKATFEQHCESQTAPALKGEVAYNALDNSVPTAAINPIIDTPEGSTVNLDASNSFDPNGSPLSFSWSTNEPGLIIQNKNTSRPNFVAPSLPNGATSKTMTATVLVKNTEGYKAQQTATFNVIANKIASSSSKSSSLSSSSSSKSSSLSSSSSSMSSSLSSSYSVSSKSSSLSSSSSSKSSSLTSSSSSSVTPTTVNVQFTCKNGSTVMGQNVYAVGNIAALGAWKTAAAIKLSPTAYPTWTKTITLPANTAIAWKCIKMTGTAVNKWQPGNNNLFTTPSKGTASTAGTF